MLPCQWRAVETSSEPEDCPVRRQSVPEKAKYKIEQQGHVGNSDELGPKRSVYSGARGSYGLVCHELNLVIVIKVCSIRIR